MANILYLVHRLPFPPNKGDKVRSFHLLQHLASEHRVFVGTFIDNPEGEAHVEALRAYCADLYVARLQPSLACLRSLRGLCSRQALTLPYYWDAGLAHWVQQTAAQENIDAAVVFSSAMAQYLDPLPQLPMLVDFVDVDSAKWLQYGKKRCWPLSWIYGREGRCLLAHERTVAARAQRSFFVTETEAALFRGLAPECADRIDILSNGVDTDFFAPQLDRPSPFAAGDKPIVFTGAMDYWPNVDAVTWFTYDVLPRLLVAWPDLSFHIVGRNPTAAVQALASANVKVIGTVPDVRPYLQHAAAVVAPLRIARGIQNKILEAMAMGRPVVASQSCVEALEVSIDTEVLSASLASEFARKVDALLCDPVHAGAIGQAARRRAVRSYSWAVHLSGIDPYLPSVPPLEIAA